MIEKLYDAYHLELVRWASLMTKDSGMAEELVQEAFLRVMIHAGSIAHLKEEQQKAWLYRTVKNLYVDRIRHTASESIMEEIPEKPSVYQNQAAEMLQLEWQELLESLPDLEGVLFSLRYLEGYNSSQLGKMFQLPPGTVRSKLSSARRHLRQALGENG